MQGKLYRGYEQCREKNCIVGNTNTNPTGKQLQYLFESIKIATVIISSPGNINREWLGQTLYSPAQKGIWKLLAQRKPVCVAIGGIKLREGGGFPLLSKGEASHKGLPKPECKL